MTNANGTSPNRALRVLILLTASAAAPIAISLAIRHFVLGV